MPLITFARTHPVVRGIKIGSNQPPQWQSVPTPSFVLGVASNYPPSGTYQSNGYVTDANSDAITITWITGSVSGVTWDGGKFVYDGLGSVGTTGSLVLRASDGVDITDSSAFSIEILSNLAWSATPSVSFVEAGVTPINLGLYVTNYNASTDEFRITPSYSLPAWLSLTTGPGTGSGNLTPNGNQVDADDVSASPGIKIDVRRSGGAWVSSNAFGVTVVFISTGEVLAERFRVPPPSTSNWNGWTGQGKHHSFAKVGTKWYNTCGDWAAVWANPQPNQVANQPSDQDGRQEIMGVDLNQPEHVWTFEQPHWPTSAYTSGFLFWSPDDAGSISIGSEIVNFRSTGVVGSPSGSEPPGIGTLIVGKFGAWNPSTHAWRELGSRPSELGGDNSWGGAYDSVNGEMLFVAGPRAVVRIRASDGADLSPRSGGNIVQMGTSGTMDTPASCVWSVPRGFIADGPSGEGPCLWTWDTQNHYLCVVEIDKLRSWNGSSFTLGAPGKRVRRLPAVEASGYSGQANTSLTYDVAHDMICVWGLTQPGYLHMLLRANATTADWISVLRPDRVVNDLGVPQFCQRHYYDSTLQKTFCFGLIDFTANLPEHPYFLVSLNVPSWAPDYGQVAAVAGTVANPSKPSDHTPASGFWDCFGSKSLNNIITAWNSGYYNKWGPSVYGNIGILGGGDGDRPGDDIYDAELTASVVTWRRLVNPAPGPVSVVPPTDNAALDQPNGEIDANDMPLAPHVYDNQFVLPPTESGHTHGAVCWPIGRYTWGPNFSTTRAHKANLGVPSQTVATSAWSRASAAANGPGGPDGCWCWDTVNKRGLGFQTGASAGGTFIDRIWTLGSFSGGVGTFGSIALDSTLTLGDDPTCEWWEEQRLVVMVGTRSGAFALDVYDPATAPSARSIPPLSFVGSAPYVDAGYGLCFVPRLRAFFLQVVGAVNANTPGTIPTTVHQKVWRLQPPAYGTSPKTGTWTVTEITMVGDTVEYAQTNGAWKRFCYAEKADCIMWIHSVSGKTYAYRPPTT